MPYATVYGFVWISGSFGAELPYRPVFTMLGVEELDELVEGVSVGELRVRLRGAGPGAGDVSEIQQFEEEIEESSARSVTYVAMMRSVT